MGLFIFHKELLMSLLVKGLFLLILGSMPLSSYACAVCGYGQDGSTWAFISTTIILTIVPLVMAGLICWYIQRKVKLNSSEDQ